MSELVKALEESPNLANRALVLLLEDENNAKKIKEWISENSKYDIRFARLSERIGIPTNKWKGNISVG